MSEPPAHPMPIAAVHPTPAAVAHPTSAAVAHPTPTAVATPWPPPPGAGAPAGPPPVPRPPGWWRRTWVPLTEPAGRPAVAGVAVVALLGAWVLRLDRGGVDWLILAGALAVVSVVVRHRASPKPLVGGGGGGVLPQPGRTARVGWAVAALALVAVGTVRADGLLDTWCLLAALACGSVALAGGGTMRGLAAGSIAFLIGAARAVPWWGRGGPPVRYRWRAYRPHRAGQRGTRARVRFAVRQC